MVCVTSEAGPRAMGTERGRSSVRGCRFYFVFVYLIIKVFKCSPVPASFFPIYELCYIGAETREEGGTRCQRALAAEGDRGAEEIGQQEVAETASGCPRRWCWSKRRTGGTEGSQPWSWVEAGWLPSERERKSRRRSLLSSAMFGEEQGTGDLLPAALDRRSHRHPPGGPNMPRGLFHVAGSERRILSHPGSPPSQMILEIRIGRGGMSIQGPVIWAIPGSLHFYTKLGCGSLPSATDGNPHTQLPRRLAHSGPVAESFNIAQHPPAQPLRLPGAQGQLCLEHTVTQPMGFVPGSSYQCRWQQLSQRNEPWQFSAMRPPSRKVPPVRSKLSRECWALWQRLHRYFSWVCFTCNPSSSWWSRGFHPRPGVTLEGHLLAKARRDPRHGAQKEGCHDRCFQQGLGSAVWGQTDLRPMVRRGVGPAHQLPRNASSVSGLSILPAGHSGTPCANTLRQQIRGVIHKSPGLPRLEATLHAGERPSCVGSDQSALTEGDTCAGQNEPRSRHVVEEQCLFRGMDAPPTRGSENLGNLWQGSSRPLRLQIKLSLPNLFYK